MREREREREIIVTLHITCILTELYTYRRYTHLRAIHTQTIIGSYTHSSTHIHAITHTHPLTPKYHMLLDVKY